MLLSYYLISRVPKEEKAKLIIQLYEKDMFSYDDVASLVDAIIEISRRTLPFLMHNLKSLDLYIFHYDLS